MAKKHRDPIPVPDDSAHLDVVRSNSELNAVQATEDYKPGSGMGAVVMHHLVTATIVAALLALGVWGYLTYRDADFFGETMRPTPFERPAVTSQVDRLHFALDVYFAIYGKYPASLDGLVDEGLLSTSDLTYPPGSSTIVYERLGDTYQIMVERTTTRTEMVVVEPDVVKGSTNGASDDSAEAPSEAEEKAKN